MSLLEIGLIGDRDDTVRAHRGIPIALALAGRAIGREVLPRWLPTDQLGQLDAQLRGLDGLWCVPASPYASMDGALAAIRYARTHGRPFLGTCGGFQHAVIEHARNVLGLADADHAETSPDGPRLVVAPLSCSLVGARGAITLASGSRLAAAFGSDATVEEYHCNYGVNAGYRELLERDGLRFTAADAAGEIRGLERDDHQFFVATLFQPELSALREQVHPLIVAFVRAAAG